MKPCTQQRSVGNMVQCWELPVLDGGQGMSRMEPTAPVWLFNLLHLLYALSSFEYNTDDTL